MYVFTSRESFREAVGKELGTSDWLLIDQQLVTRFGEATLDTQWIHVDPVRAAKGPFGGTIAHGHLVLSLVPALSSQTYTVKNSSMEINYGSNRVRFPSPTHVGTRICATTTLTSIEEFDDAVQTVFTVIVRAEDGEKPVCVAEIVMRSYFSTED